MATRKKIGLIGAGNIGGELARLCANKELGDVWLYDIPAKENFAKGKALDLEQNGAILGYDSKRPRHRQVGRPRRAPTSSSSPPASRASPVSRVTTWWRRTCRSSATSPSHVKEHCPDAFVIVISNPLDAMVYELKKVAGLAKNKVVGMAGVLDSARFQLFLAREAGVSVKDVKATVLGGHGDDMVPVLGSTTINGIPVSQLIAKDKIDAMIDRTRKGGGEIVNLMGTSAYYAPASSAVSMAEAYLLDQKRLLAGAAYLEGEYGYKDFFMGVPVVIGGNGIEKIVTIELSDAEKAMLEKSAKSVQSVVDVVKKTA